MSVFLTFDSSVESWGEIAAAAYDFSVYEMKIEYIRRLQQDVKDSFYSIITNARTWDKNVIFMNTVVSSYPSGLEYGYACDKYAHFASDLDEDTMHEMFSTTKVCSSRSSRDNAFRQSCGRCERCLTLERSLCEYGIYDVM